MLNLDKVLKEFNNLGFTNGSEIVKDDNVLMLSFYRIWRKSYPNNIFSMYFMIHELGVYSFMVNFGLVKERSDINNIINDFNKESIFKCYIDDGFLIFKYEYRENISEDMIARRCASIFKKFDTNKFEMSNINKVIDLIAFKIER